MPALKLSFCLISRDNEKTIRNTLESIKGLAYEIIVVDTGSNDRTCEIVREYTNKLFHFPWIDDFSAARNASISHATGNWIFIIDTDEVLPETSQNKLFETIIAAKEKGFTALACPQVTYQNKTIIFVSHIQRCFLNGLSKEPFVGIVHERLKSLYKTTLCNIKIDHFIHTSANYPETKSFKSRHKLIERDYQRDPKDRNAIHNLISSYLDIGQPEKVLALLNENLLKEKDFILSKAQALASLNRDQEAMAILAPLLTKQNHGLLDLRPYLMYGQLLCKTAQNVKAYALYKSIFAFTPEDLLKQTSSLFIYEQYFLSLIQACYLAEDHQDNNNVITWAERLIANGYYVDQASALLNKIKNKI